MPIILNLIEACRYKRENPDRKIYYKHEYGSVPHEEGYFIEELTEFREEFSFQLVEGQYPSYWDQDDFGWSQIYTRHIFGEMSCETEEEELIRLEKEKVEKQKEVEKQQKELDVQIKKLQDKKKKLQEPV